VSDKREQYKADIRAAMPFEEVTNITFYTPDDITIDLVHRWTHFTDFKLKAGELGAWMSHLSCLQWVVDHDQWLIVLEDDAKIMPGFKEWFDSVNVGSVALFVPPNQYNDYHIDGYLWYEAGAASREIGHDKVVKAYQGYSCVAIKYEPQTAAELLKRFKQQGITNPIDCQIFEQGLLNAPRPQYATGVDYYNTETHIHDTEQWPV